VDPQGKWRLGSGVEPTVDPQGKWRLGSGVETTVDPQSMWRLGSGVKATDGGIWDGGGVAVSHCSGNSPLDTLNNTSI